MLSSTTRTISLLVFLLLLIYPAFLWAENIPLTKKGGVYELPVEVNGVITLNFILDTGASEVNIPADVALTLYRTGTITDADFLSDQTYKLADGSLVKNARFILKSLKIGKSRITNVPASIGGTASTLLLGQSFLKRFETWSIDNKRVALIVKPLIEPVPSQTSRPKLIVNPLRLSRQTAQIGERLTIHLEVVNSSKHRAHGVVLVNYPEHLVSFIALHATGQESMVQLPTTPPNAAPKVTYQLLWSHWPAWIPGERRTAVIALVPRLPQDITLHISVIIENEGESKGPAQRWSRVVRIPFQTKSER